MNVSCCTKMKLRCKKRQGEIEHKYIGGKWPKIGEAPDPSLIVWKNLGKGKIVRCGLQTATNILSGILLLVGFVTIIYLMEKKEEYAIDTTLCGDHLTTKSEAFSAWNNYRKLDT